MIDYIGNMIDNIPEYMKGESVTPVAHHLFDIVEDATKLSRTHAEFLITLWCKYYTCKREHIHTYIWQCHYYALGR